MQLDEPTAIALAQDAADRLQGTCRELRDLGPEFEEAESNSKFCDELDMLIFRCEVCEWWCEQGEQGSGPGEVCGDCS